jgi:uncharacterized protein (TIGR00645 family)
VTNGQPRPTNRIGFAIEHASERFLFASRWLLAPVYIGMVAAIVVIAIKFFEELVHLVQLLFHSTDSETASEATVSGTNEIVLGVLALLDLALLANLVVIVIFAGYENFVSKITSARNAEDRPNWMGHIDFSGLKMKLIGSIVAISVIGLLQDFTKVGTEWTPEEQSMRIALHIVFLLSGIGFAFMDWLGEKRLQLAQITHSDD